MKSELRPIGVKLIIDSTNPLYGYTPEEILFAGERVYDDVWTVFQSRVGDLKKQYDSWPVIPNRIRAELTNELRQTGFIFNPNSKRGRWSPPNSVALSSMRY